MDRILCVKDLKKAYKEFLLDGVSFQLNPGSIMGMIGPNGSGKTTTIKIIMNLLKADNGTVEVFGLTYGNNEKEIKNRIGYVGEEQYFYQNKTVAWTEKFVSQFYRQWDKSRFHELLLQFNISAAKKIKELSKGMKVKLALAIALSHNPELLILDEPTSGLDPIIRREILDLLQKTSHEENKSVLFSSHITDDILRISDFVTFIVNGKIKLIDEKDELLSKWKRIHFKVDSLPDSIKNSLKNRQDQMFGSSGITDQFLKIRQQMASGIDSGTVKVENVNLDDILISFVTENERL